ncbi:MAG: CHAT domain-containing protein [Verrucomicrobiota bacterium]
MELPPEELETKTIHLDSPEGWFQLLDETGIYGQEAGLILISAKASQLPAIAAAAYVALRNVTFSDTGESRFTKLQLVLPPGKIEDSFRKDTIKRIQAQMKAAGLDEFLIKLFPFICETRSMVSQSGAHLIDDLRQLQPESVSILIHPELYRLPLQRDPASTGGATHITMECSRHLNSLIGTLATTSKKTKSLIVLLADQSLLDINAIIPPEDIDFLAISSGASTDEVPEFHLEPLLDAFRKGGWPALEADSGFDPDREQEIAFALVNVFVKEKDLSLAWAAMEPFADQAGDLLVGSQICIAGAALIAGDWNASHKLLANALNEEIQTPEELHAALTVAYSLGNVEMMQQILEEMLLRHPDSTLTRRGEFLQFFQKRDFGNALKIAEDLKLPVEIAKCRAFLSCRIGADEFLSEMEKIGELEQGLMSCADEAVFRKLPRLAIKWANRIPDDHPMFERAFRLRVKALRIGLRKDKGTKFLNKSTKFLPELESVMRIVAKRPADTHLRGQLELLLENQLEEPLVKLLLSTLLMVAVNKQSSRDDQSIEAASLLLSSRDMSRGIQKEEQIKEFMEAAFESLANTAETSFMIGQGQLPPAVQPMVGPKLIQWLAEGALEYADEGIDAERASMLIYLVCLCCKVVDEPVMDVSLVHCIVERLSTFGAAQDCRNLAETALQSLPGLQPTARDWRISQGWTSLSEACLRSGNRLAALRYLCLAFVAHENAALSIELLRRRYRMAARILRDLSIVPAALHCIAVEKQLLTKADAMKGEEIPLEVFEMQLRIMGLDGEKKEVLLQTLARSQELLEMGVSSELYPLTAVQANILRILSPEKCPTKIVEDFQRRVASFPPQLGSMLRMTACLNPTREDMVALLRGLPDAQDHEYLAYQMHLALPALSNALRHAVVTGDSELFVLASGAFAQPALGVQITDGKGEVAHDDRPTLMRTTTLEGLRNGTFEIIPRYSFGPLADITINQLQSCLVEDEAVLVMAGEPGMQPNSMLVTSTDVAAPRLVTEWSDEAFRQWSARFKEDLFWEKPNPYVPGIDALTPPVRKVREFLDGLSLGLTVLPKQLTILPPSHLFGFTWQLSRHGTGFLTEHTSLAIAPSAPWLVAARTTAWAGNHERRAWIGSKETTDSTLIALRAMVDGALTLHEVVTSDDAGPYGFAGCELAVIGAHGGTGFNDYFRSVGDRVNHYSPSEMANMLTGCGCVVLAVCSGGRSDGQTGSAEALGLVTSLFRAGVRCVIAPPWPLDIEVVQHWLPAFLESMDAGYSVGMSATRARVAVRLELDHPCAWGQLHIYGDQNFCLESASALSGSSVSPVPPRSPDPDSTQ